MYTGSLPPIPLLIITGALVLFALCLFLPPVIRRLPRTLSDLRGVILLLLLSLFLSLFLAHRINAERLLIKERFSEKEMRATFTVEEIIRYENVTSLSGLILVDGEEQTLRATVSLFGETVFEEADGGYCEIAAGDTLSGVFTLSAIPNGTLPELWRFADGYDLTGIYLKDGICLSHGNTTLKSTLFSLREKLASFLDATLTESGSAMMKALLLADRSGIPKSVREGFDTLGISHLLAVSGLHLAIVIGLFMTLLGKLPVRRGVRDFLLTAVILLYLVITAFTPSMLRAGGMLMLVYLSHLVRRQRDSVSTLMTAMVLITLIAPRSIVDLGLLFSFASTFGIVTLASPILRRISESSLYSEAITFPQAVLKIILKLLLPPSIVTLSATLTILPVLWLSSGEIFLLSPLSNLVFAPFFTLLLYLMPLFLLTAPIPLLGDFVGYLVEVISRLLFRLAEGGTSLSFFSFSLRYRFVPYLLAFILIACLILLWKKQKRLILIAALSFFLLLPAGAWLDARSRRHTETVSYYTDGKNDLVSISYENRRMLCVFSSSAAFVRNTVNDATLESPSVVTDTVLFSELPASFVGLIRDLDESSSVTTLILPKGQERSEYITAYAESLGFTVLLYTPRDTVVYNGIPVTTYENGNKTVALTLSTAQSEILYLKENAPNLFDIRFGVMEKHFDVTILGAYGTEPIGALSLDSNTIWEPCRRSYVTPDPNYERCYGNNLLRNEREE